MSIEAELFARAWHVALFQGMLWGASWLPSVIVEMAASTKVSRRHRLINMGWGLLSVLTIALAVVAVFPWVSLTWIAVLPFRPEAGFFWDRVGWGSVVWAPLVFLLVHDVAYYAYHRWQHRSRIGWWLHRLHHSDPDLNATSYFRQNALEGVAQAALFGIPLMLCFPLSPPCLLVMWAFVAAFQFWIHADVPVRYGRMDAWIVSPRQHRLHHDRVPYKVKGQSSHGTSNFASMFPWTDRCFGTFRSPVPDGRCQTGLFGSPSPSPSPPPVDRIG